MSRYTALHLPSLIKNSDDFNYVFITTFKSMNQFWCFSDLIHFYTVIAPTPVIRGTSKAYSCTQNNALS